MLLPGILTKKTSCISVISLLIATTITAHAQHEEQTDQALLAKMGMWVNPELTQQVTDQALLAKIAGETKNWDVHLAAVEKLTDLAS